MSDAELTSLALELLIADLVGKTPEGKVFTLLAPLKLTVAELIPKEQPDDLVVEDDDEVEYSYRSKALSGHEEFFLKGIEIGKANRLAFHFAPVDAAGYDFAIMDELMASQSIKEFDAWFEGAAGAKRSKAPQRYRAKAAQALRERLEAEQDEAAARNRGVEQWGAF